jgi:hypothetical protein
MDASSWRTRLRSDLPPRILSRPAGRTSWGAPVSSASDPGPYAWPLLDGEGNWGSDALFTNFKRIVSPGDTGIWIARRRTRTEIYQLAPARSLHEIQAKIDEYNAHLSWEELIAA